ncbi:MAG: NAD-glutamate dehydrogenase domain-containing protein, partial [Myxococcota bacterium]
MDWVETLTASLRQTAQEVVPRFLNQMPPSYFNNTDEATRLAHLRAIVAAAASGLPPALQLRSPDGLSWTFIRQADYPGMLAELLEELPDTRPLRSAEVYTAQDGKLVLDVFSFGIPERCDPNQPDHAQKIADTLAQAEPEKLDALRLFVHSCPADYLLKSPHDRLVAHAALFHAVRGHDGVVVERQPRYNDKPDLDLVHIAIGGGDERLLFARIARLLGHHTISIERGFLNPIATPDGLEKAIILSFVIRWPGGRAPDQASWTAVKQNILRVPWLDEQVLDLGYSHPALGLRRAELLIALCHLAHVALNRRNPFAFSRERIVQLALRHLTVTIRIIDRLLAQCQGTPPSAEEDAAIGHAIERLGSEDAQTVLGMVWASVRGTLRCNVLLESRFCLAFRFEPEAILSSEREAMPHGVFFLYGDDFDAFHVRFRDIARGGVRVVSPRGMESYTLESERLFDEAYGLAFAQQLKNKDIPEGGAKAVILVQPGADQQRCVRAFADGMLDLLLPSPHVLDRLGHPEWIYLGPDEGITPALIEWIVERAAQRGYPQANAFMSSKPGAGINHKVYGVTSEGVTVFLETALRAVGIEPTRDRFTVKLTGGPDGDVAGNEIRILHTRYGDRARIVAVADGSGVAEDPEGLDYPELLRLVAAEEGIAGFDMAKLSPKGRRVGVDEPEGVRLRNTMHNRIVADAFIPAGGRPQTIHAGNWRDYLTPAGTPSSRVIVEGANLFLTPEARTHLSAQGVLILKDSSANKCGVICSSFEIAASMVLEPKAFLAIKPRFVAEVLERLRLLARLEAELLMREHAHQPDADLPGLSVRVSRAILRKLAGERLFGAED